MLEPEVLQPEVGPVGEYEGLPGGESLDPVEGDGGGGEEAVQGAAEVEAGASVERDQGPGGSHHRPGWAPWAEDTMGFQSCGNRFEWKCKNQFKPI